MSERFQKLGIKQTIQRHWMDHTVQMMLAGMSEKNIRAELDDYLSTQKAKRRDRREGKKNLRYGDRHTYILVFPCTGPVAISR